MIKIDRLTVRYNNEIPFRELSFEVKRGEKVTLTGPSGSGKSTLLNVIPGFVYPEQGNVYINNTLLSEDTVTDLRKLTAWLPQELNLELDNVETLLYYPFGFKENKDKKPSKEKVCQLLDRLLLEENLLTKSLQEISGGQKQRIALCSAILLEKPVLLLDEPTSALDDKSCDRVCEMILALTDTTVLAASHDHRWINKMGRQIEIKN